MKELKLVERSENEKEWSQLVFDLVPGLSDHIQIISPKQLSRLAEEVR